MILHRIIEPGDLMEASAPQEPCLVRMANGYALRFHLRGFAVVADAEATQFTNREIADEIARSKGLRWGQFEVEAIAKEVRAA